MTAQLAPAARSAQSSSDGTHPSPASDRDAKRPSIFSSKQAPVHALEARPAMEPLQEPASKPQTPWSQSPRSSEEASDAPVQWPGAPSNTGESTEWMANANVAPSVIPQAPPPDPNNCWVPPPPTDVPPPPPGHTFDITAASDWTLTSVAPPPGHPRRVSPAAAAAASAIAAAAQAPPRPPMSPYSAAWQKHRATVMADAVDTDSNTFSVAPQTSQMRASPYAVIDTNQLTADTIVGGFEDTSDMAPVGSLSMQALPKHGDGQRAA